MENKLLNYYIRLLSNNGIPKFLIKYLNVPCLLRLKRVSYLCGMDYASKEIYNFKEQITRFDHSYTVALLTWMCTKDKKATIAGLFHDIATPCFSHVIDYMNKDYANQESTEEYTERIIKNDKYLLSCLKQDNIDIDEIINFKKYSIVDIDRPMVCADRLDGIILTGITWTRNIEKEDIENIINSIEVYTNEDGRKEIGIDNLSIAQKVKDISETIDVVCHSNEDNYMMELLADITRNCINRNYIKYKDLYLYNENYMMNKIKSIKDQDIKEKLDIFENVKFNEIPKTEICNVKKRELNPLVKGIRLDRY